MSKKKDETAEQTPKATPAKPASGNAAAVTGKGRSLAERIADFKEYLILSRRELSKVSWPNWKETRKTSLVVLGFVVVMAILLGLVDLVLSGVIRLILS
ncbi:MAG: preprotein translocase subunit SecE [Mailhella sp.]|nr:preprotein translocase subunit SecE [Pseudomonas sp.]MBP3730882.1 preprotein translocase subunit SecE [Mailhella sp.]